MEITSVNNTRSPTANNSFVDTYFTGQMYINVALCSATVMAYTTTTTTTTTTTNLFAIVTQSKSAL
jgi:hypothetical protein